MSLLWLLIILIILVSGCGSATSKAAAPAETTLLPGDPERGKIVFNGAGACSACHAVEGDTVIVGPSLSGVATRAGSRKPGMSAEAYITESILTPNAYVVDGFKEGLMPQTFSERLTRQQLVDVMAYLLTLKQ